MRYAIFDIELTRPLPDLPLCPGDAGAAILVRRKDIPVAFWMEVANPTGRLSADVIVHRIAVEAGVQIVGEAIREELATASPSVTLPSMTIAICTRDRTASVERLLVVLHPLVGKLPAASGPCEILIVDNVPSDDRTHELAGRWSGVRYVREPRLGLNFARNRAVREARGELLAFLDDDVIPDRHWLDGLSDAWTANRDAALFTGQVLPMELESEAQIAFEARGGFRRGFDRMRYGPVMPGNSLYPAGVGTFGTGANMTFRTEVLRKLGGFDEALDTGASVPGGGDLDIFYRTIRAGYPLVYEPRFLVFHQHRREMKELRRQYRRSWGLGFMCYVGKCLKTDRERRIALLRLVIWWFNRHIHDVVTHLSRNGRQVDRLSPSLFLGEMYGGVVGLLGGYGRSARRVGRIRRRFQ
jgi:glycosyltransferase involved in cell wall biosynthesis